MQQAEWEERAAVYAQRAEPWVHGRLERRARGEKNAVDDFLFEYYNYSPRKLVTWHPGYGVVLEGPRAHEYLEHAGYVEVPGGVTADLAFLDPRRQRLDLALRILDGTRTRKANTACFALHEWAMTYHLTQEQVRHAYLPLRVSPATIAEIVDDVGLTCTHIDAFRFFTDDAMPLNALQPTRATQPDLEQPGCMHASMDLFKYAYWFSPLIGSDLILDCFELAAKARELDMRASPYDVARFELEPVRVETADGRREYVELQRELMLTAEPVRAQLRASLAELAAATVRIPERSAPPA